MIDHNYEPAIMSMVEELRELKKAQVGVKQELQLLRVFVADEIKRRRILERDSNAD